MFNHILYTDLEQLFSFEGPIVVGVVVREHDADQVLLAGAAFVLGHEARVVEQQQIILPKAKHTHEQAPHYNVLWFARRRNKAQIYARSGRDEK
jgi:hypothetical protein